MVIAEKQGRGIRKRRGLVLASLLYLLAVQPGIAIGTEISGVTQSQQGRELYERGEYQRAASSWERAAAEFAARGDALNQAMALSNLSLTYQELGKWEEATRAIAQSQEILQGQEVTAVQQRMVAQTLDIQGQQQIARGQTASALETWEKAAEIYNEIGDRESLIGNQINQAQGMKDLGFYPRSCKMLQQALGLSSQSCTVSAEELASLKSQRATPQQVLGMEALGDVMRLVGRSPESKEVLVASLQLGRELGDSGILAEIYLSLGNTMRALANRPGLNAKKRRGLIDEAIGYYQSAAKRSKTPITFYQAQVNQLSMLVISDRANQAARQWQQLSEKIQKFPPNRRAVYTQINLAGILLDLKTNQQIAKEYIPSVDRIDQLLANAANYAEAWGDDRTYAYAMGLRGKLYEESQQWEVAASLTKAALSKASSFNAPDISYQLLWQLGRLETAVGKKASAISSYTKAVNTIKSIRSDLATVNPEVQFSFAESVEPVYRELVDLLLQPGANQSNLQQARELIEALQLAELDNFFQDACLKARPQQIDEVDPKAAVIYPIVLPDRLEVILSLPGQPLRQYRTEMSKERATRVVKRMRGSLNPLFSSKQRLLVSQKIYDWLIRPAAEDLAASEVETLVFVLDGVLRNIPMAALHDGQQYLLEKYKIALTPGLQLLESRGLQVQELTALTMGISEARQGFPALPGVEFELQKIQSEVPAEVRLNQQFTSQTLQDQIAEVPFPIIHLATHGQFSSQAEETFLLTWDGKINVKELDQLLRTREQEPSPIELLVLSACETASGDQRAVLGLAGVAVRSGARSTIATLWQVNDASSAVLMAEFYNQLSEAGVTKAEALRRAQLSILQQGRYSDPYYWAPFVLVGNWL
ncbi:MAG: CHAT domain-containing protein [Hormoscilla sp.]